MAKNPRPGYATEKQVQWLATILRKAGRNVDDERIERFRNATQDAIRKATTRAEIMRAEYTGTELPSWVKPATLVKGAPEAYNEV